MFACVSFFYLFFFLKSLLHEEEFYHVVPPLQLYQISMATIKPNLFLNTMLHCLILLLLSKGLRPISIPAYLDIV